MKQPFAVYLLALLQILMALSALSGGGLLMVRTDGSLLGMEPGWLTHSPFSDYLVPGVCLFFFLGVLPLLVAIGLMNRTHWRGLNAFNIYPNRHWSWTFSLYSGVVIISWITLQLALTEQYFWLQPVVIGWGLTILVITLLPSVIKSFER